MPTSAPSTPRRPPATPVTPRPTPRNASASRSCSPASVSTSKKNKEPMNRPLGQLAKNTVAAHTVAMKNYIAYCKSAVPNFENIDSISFEDCMKIEWWTGFAQYLLNTQLSRKTILQYLSGVKEYYRLANPTMFRALFDEKSYTLLRVNVEKATFEQESPDDLLTLSFGRNEMTTLMETLLRQNRVERVDQAVVCLTSFMASGRANELLELKWDHLSWNSDFQATICNWKQPKVYSFKNITFHCDYDTAELDWHFLMGAYVLLGAGN